MDMIEKIARAIKDARALPGTNPVARLSDVDRRAARATLKALRNPTFAMKMAGAEAITLGHMTANANYEAACDAWTTMIDAALAGEGKDR